MKKNIIHCILFILSIYIVKAQNRYNFSDNYYIYKDGQKTYLTPVEGEVVVTFKKYSSTSCINRCLEKYHACLMNQIQSTPSIRLTLPNRQATPTVNLQTTLEMLEMEENIAAVYPVLEWNGQKIYINNRMVYTLRAGIQEETVAQALKHYTYQLEEVIFLRKKKLIVLEVGEDENVFEIANLLYEKGLVEYAEPDFTMACQSDFYVTETFETESSILNDPPNDPAFSQQWFLTQDNDADIDAPEAWNITSGDESVVVAVIDGHGYDFSHPDLEGNVVNPYDAVYDTNTPTPQNNYATHGTPCAGLIGAITNNERGVAGVGNSIKVMPISIGYNIQPDGTFSTSSTAIARAASQIINTPGVVAVSNSFALSFMSSAMQDSYREMHTQSREGLGAVILASSGNWNNENQLIYPYSLQEVIGVGASGIQDTRAGFSNYGNELGIVAPGESLYTLAGNTGYGHFGGTSAACPVAAGIVGLMGSVNINTEVDQLEKILLQTCDKVGGYTYENSDNHAYGTWNKEMGYGRVNAYNAVKRVQSLNPPAAPIHLTATPGSSSQIKLSWQDTSVNETGFEIQVSEGNNAKYASVATVDANISTYIHKNLREGATYYYRVFAFNEDGKSPYSNESGTTTLGRPLAPQNLAGATIANNKVIELTWEDNSETEDSFLIQRFLLQGNLLTEGQEYILEANAMSYEDTNVKEGQIYRYQVWARNTYGTAASNTVDIAVGALEMAKTTFYNVCGKVFLDEGGTQNYSNSQNIITYLQPNEENAKVRLEFSSFQLEENQDHLWIYDGDNPTPRDLLGKYTGTSLPPVITSSRGALTLHFISNNQNSDIGWEATIHCVYPTPAAPDDLHVNVMHSSEFKLDWQDNSEDETGFEIWRSEGNEFIRIHTTEANMTTFTDAHVEPTQTYSYKVVAINEYGYSDFSKEVQAHLVALLPNSPENVTIQPLSRSEIRLDWDTPATTTLVKFQVFRLNTFTRTFELIAELRRDINSFTDEQLEAGTSYVYTLKTEDAYGNVSNWSEEVSATTWTNIPVTPSELTAKALSVTEILLTWQDNSDNETAFIIEGMTVTGEFVEIDRIGADQTSFTHQNLTPNTTYTYRVIAFNESVNISYWESSNQAEATTQSIYSSIPFNVQAIATSPNEILLTWESEDVEVDSFEIYRWDETTRMYTKIAEKEAPDLIFRDQDLLPSISYKYIIKGHNAYGVSGSSEVAQATTLSAAPSLVTAKNVSETSVTLLWQDNSINEIYFSIESADAQGNFTEIARVEANQTFFQIQDLKANTMHQYKIKAIGVGWEAGSDSLSITTLPYVLPPANLTAEAYSSKSILLTWENSLLAAQIEIQRFNPYTRNFEQIALLEASFTSWMDEGVQPVVEYTYRARTVYADKTSDWSEIATAKTSGMPMESLVSPNPSTGIFYLELGSLGVKEVLLTVVDLYGRTILQTYVQDIKENTGELLDLTGYKSGEYLLKIQLPGKQILEKLFLLN